MTNVRQITEAGTPSIYAVFAERRPAKLGGDLQLSTAPVRAWLLPYEGESAVPVLAFVPTRSLEPVGVPGEDGFVGYAYEAEDLRERAEELYG